MKRVSKCSRVSFIGINVIFCLIGTALMIVSCIVRYDHKTADSYLGYSSFQTALQNANVRVHIPKSLDISETIDAIFIVFIVVGAIVLLIGVLGIVGAIRKAKALLVTYAVVLLILVLLQLICVVLVATIPGKIESWIKESLKDSIRNDYTGIGGNDTATLRWNFIMHSFKCCGVDSYNDFVLLEAKRWNKYVVVDQIVQRKKLPFACCKQKNDTDCVRNPTSTSAFTEKGCYQVMKAWVINKMDLMLGVGVSILALQVILVVIAFMMCCKIQKRANDGDDDKDLRQPNRTSHAHLVPGDPNLFYLQNVTSNPAYDGPRLHGSSLAMYPPHPSRKNG